jgi:DNA-binding transcriptional ArsR family regulator
MPENSPVQPSSWRKFQSISLELDAAIAVTGGHLLGARLTPEYALLMDMCSPILQREREFLFNDINWYNAVMESLAILTGVFDRGDYETATRSMRAITASMAFESLLELCKQINFETHQLELDENLFPRLYMDYRNFAFKSIGLTFPTDRAFSLRTIRETEFCLRILKGGDLHITFWDWMDRFYFEVYQPWRLTRQNFINGLEQKFMKLAAFPGTYFELKESGWLPDTNPALRYPELDKAINSGAIEVNLWEEPFGFADYWVLLPGQVFLTIADPGKMYKNFLKHSENLARQAKALADPTRLTILRLIRELSMTNTDMAAYLGLARPTVSIHAKILREAGLIHSWEDGRIMRHEIIPGAVRTLFNGLEDYLDLPDNEEKVI